MTRDSAYYAAMFESAKILKGWDDHRLDYSVRRILHNKNEYLEVETQTGVPWVVAGLLHSMEAGCDRGRDIADGSRFSGADWVSVASAQLDDAPLSHRSSWNLPDILEYLERWNGMGYSNKGIATPYLWSGSNHGLGVGKYVADGKYDPAAVSKQVGAAVLLQELINRGEWYPVYRRLQPEQFAEIPGKLFPVLCFSYHIGSIVSSIVAKISRCPFSHVFWMVDKENCVSQDWTYRIKPMSEYLSGKYHVQTYAFRPSESPVHPIINTIETNIAIALEQPPWERRYDPLSILGHGIRIPWLQIPGLENCAESVANDLEDGARVHLKRHPNVGDIYRFAQECTIMYAYGEYNPMMEKKA